MANQDLFFVLLMILFYGFISSLVAYLPLMPQAKPPAYGLVALVMVIICGRRFGFL